MKRRICTFAVLLLCLAWGASGVAGAERFVDNQNGTVTDTETQLIWQKDQDWDSGGDFEPAVQYCQDLVLGPFSDWRLPRIDELRTLIDFTRYDPAIDPVFGEDTWGFFWSNTTQAGNADHAWHVDFITGYIGWNFKTEWPNYVRCVRTGPFWPLNPGEHLKNLNTNIAKDTLTNLVWQRGGDGTRRTWQEAVSYCTGLVLEGRNDWRLPNIQELQSILNYETSDPAANTNVFQTYSQYYWSLTPSTGGETEAWAVMFAGGRVDYRLKTEPYYVRCVRTPADTSAVLTVERTGKGDGTVTSSPSGIRCGSTCARKFETGTIVTLTPKAASNSVFSGWSGGCTGLKACKVVLEEDTTVTASFSLLPRVSIETVSPVASEDGKKKGVFKITRSGSTAENLLVRYGVSGTATGGVDYRKLPGKVLIPAGQSGAKIVVTALQDGKFEGKETVLVTLTGQPTYQLGSPTAGKVIIEDDD